LPGSPLSVAAGWGPPPQEQRVGQADPPRRLAAASAEGRHLSGAGRPL